MDIRARWVFQRWKAISVLPSSLYESSGWPVWGIRGCKQTGWRSCYASQTMPTSACLSETRFCYDDITSAGCNGGAARTIPVLHGNTSSALRRCELNWKKNWSEDPRLNKTESGSASPGARLRVAGEQHPEKRPGIQWNPCSDHSHVNSL